MMPASCSSVSNAEKLPPLVEIVATHNVPPLPKDVNMGIDEIIAAADQKAAVEQTRWV